MPTIFNRRNDLSRAHPDSTNQNQPSNNDSESQISIMEDILPSFQMHNFMLNRNIYDHNNTYDLSDNELPDYVSEINSIRSSVIPNNLNRYDSNENNKINLLNNVDKLKYIDAPIDIKIVLTTKPPKFGKAVEKESVLTEYRPGDLVTGYVTIKSRSDKPIPFELMTVSLEGELKTPAGGFRPNDRIIFTKPFLKTYDLNACFSYGNIPLQTHGISGELEKDDFDATIIGFDKSRNVLPNVTHKKFFSFKLPHSLLDTACPDQIPEHLHVLPTFGFDESSIADLAESLTINPILGYKRFDSVYGSSIKVDDTALIGQSISYYVKVQMVGLEEKMSKYNYKKLNSTRSSDDPKSPFILMANERYYFRVDVSEDRSVFNVDERADSTNVLKKQIKTNIRTYEQLTKFENYVVKSIAELKTKYQLREAGIFSKKEQETIIAALQVDISKKEKQLRSSTNFHQEIVRSDINNYLHYNTVDIGKEFFGRSSGDIFIKASMSKDSSVTSIRCYSLKSKAHSNSLTKKKIDKSLSNSLPVGTLDSNSSCSLKNISSLQNITKQAPQDHCFVDFELKFSGSSNKVDLPSSITISSSFKCINVYSPHPIPVSIDGEFLMDEQLLCYTIPNIRRQYEGYLGQLKLLSQRNIPVPKNLFIGVSSLSKLSVKEAYVPKFEFLSETIDLTPKWCLDSQDHVFKASIKMPLAINPKLISKSTSCVVPTFESCNINNSYMVHFHVSIKKSKKYVVFKFPITVV